MNLLARAKGRHTRCSGWGDLARMVAAYRAYPAREVEPAPVPMLSRSDVETLRITAPDWTNDPMQENQ